MTNSIEDAARDHLRKKLLCLPQGCIDVFNRMYKSIDDIPLEKMQHAELQINNTAKLLATDFDSPSSDVN